MKGAEKTHGGHFRELLQLVYNHHLAIPDINAADEETETVCNEGRVKVGEYGHCHEVFQGRQADGFVQGYLERPRNASQVQHGRLVVRPQLQSGRCATHLMSKSGQWTDCRSPEVIDINDKWMDCRLPEVIDVNDKRTGKLEHHGLQERYDVASGQPGLMQPYIPIDGLDDSGSLGAISESRSDNPESRSNT